MPRDCHLYIKDIKDSCEKILRYTQNMSPQEILTDDLVYDAVVRNLIIIGEAAKNVPEDIRNKYGAVEWKKICGVRDVVIHIYFGIDNSILIDIICNKVPELLQALSKE